MLFRPIRNSIKIPSIEYKILAIDESNLKRYK